MTVQVVVAEPHHHQIHLVAVARAAVAEVVVEINLIFNIYEKDSSIILYGIIISNIFL